MKLLKQSQQDAWIWMNFGGGGRVAGLPNSFPEKTPNSNIEIKTPQSSLQMSITII